MRWYATRNLAAATRFAQAISDAEQTVLASPASWTRHLHGTRNYRLKKFPYLVVYRAQSEFILIVAIAHAKRRPGYWARRLK